MNKKIIFGIVAIIVVVGGASLLTSGDGTKGRFYDPSGRGRGRSPVPQSYSSEPVSSYPTPNTAAAGVALSAELLPANDNITRVELAFLLYKTLDYKNAGLGVNTTGCFKDSKLTQYKNPYDNLLGENAICMLVSKNILAGFSDSTFKPFNTVSRAEAAKIFQVAFDQTYTSQSGDSKAYYADVADNKVWFYPSVAWLVNAKVADIVSAPKNNFFPSQALTHARALYWIANVKKNVPTSKWVK